MVEEAKYRIREKVPFGDLRGLGFSGYEELFDWLDSKASTTQKWDFLRKYAIRLRVCSICGAIFTEGYYIVDTFACSDACGIKHYNSRGFTAEMFHEDIDNDDIVDAYRLNSWD